VRIVLDGSKIKSVDDFYNFIDHNFCKDRDWGRNLSSLWDIFSTDIERPIELIWKDSNESSIGIGKKVFDSIC